MDADDAIRAVIYIRVSTEEQEKSGLSLSEQRETLKKWAEQRHYTVCDYYEDVASGADKLGRTALQRMIDDAKQRMFDTVLVKDDSRLTRTPGELINLLDELLEYGITIDIYSLRGIDYYESQGRYMLQNLGLFSSFEREKIAARTHEALRYKKDNDQWVGGPPYGFMVVDVSGSSSGPKDSRLELIPAEQRVIKRMKELYKHNMAHTDIARKLNMEHYRTKRGKAWTKHSVGHILNRNEEKYKKYLVG